MLDEELGVFEPFVTANGPKSRLPTKSHRRVLDGVF
jgi:hypothetical protein